MPLNVRTVEYFYVRIEESGKNGYELLAHLASEEVNLLAFSAVPFGPNYVELTIFPDRSDKFILLAKHLGWEVAGPQHAFLVQGDDHLGALADIQRMLLEANVKIYAVQRRHGWRRPLRTRDLFQRRRLRDSRARPRSSEDRCRPHGPVKPAWWSCRGCVVCSPGGVLPATEPGRQGGDPRMHAVNDVDPSRHHGTVEALFRYRNGTHLSYRKSVGMREGSPPTGPAASPPRDAAPGQSAADPAGPVTPERSTVPGDEHLLRSKGYWRSSV